MRGHKDVCRDSRSCRGRGVQVKRFRSCAISQNDAVHQQELCHFWAGNVRNDEQNTRLKFERSSFFRSARDTIMDSLALSKWSIFKIPKLHQGSWCLAQLCNDYQTFLYLSENEETLNNLTLWLAIRASYGEWPQGLNFALAFLTRSWHNSSHTISQSGVLRKPKFTFPSVMFQRECPAACGPVCPLVTVLPTASRDWFLTRHLRWKTSCGEWGSQQWRPPHPLHHRAPEAKTGSRDQLHTHTHTHTHKDLISR